MSGLQNVLRRNAWIAFDRHVADEAKRGHKFDRTKLINAMAALLPRKPTDDDTKARSRVRSALADYFPEDRSKNPTRVWRLDYLEAFAMAVNSTVTRLSHPDYDGEGKLSDADYAAVYSAAVGRHLDPKQIQRINQNLRDELRIDGMFELVSELAETLISAKNADEATGAALDVIRTSLVWRKPTAKATPKRPTRKAPSRKRK